MDLDQSTELTKIHCKALKTCDDATYRLTNGKPECLAIKRKPWNSDDPWADDVRFEIPIDNSHTVTYGTGKYHSAYAHVQNYGQSTHGTMTRFIRPGDRLRLRWIADANQYTREAGLFIDQLQVVVVRKTGNFVFDVDTSVCPDNSARMMQGTTYELA